MRVGLLSTSEAFGERRAAPHLDRRQDMQESAGQAVSDDRDQREQRAAVTGVRERAEKCERYSSAGHCAPPPSGVAFADQRPPTRGRCPWRLTSSHSPSCTWHMTTSQVPIVTFMLVQDLVGTAEIAKMLGVSRQRVHQLTSSPGFPEPESRLEMGVIWDAEKVRTWAREHGRQI